MWLRSAALAAVLLATTSAPASASRPLDRLVGQTIVTGMSGTRPDAALLARVRRGEVGGVILFGANIGSTASVGTAIASLQRAAAAGGNPPLLVAVDQEGGAVRRLPGPPTQSEPALGALRSAGKARAEGKATGAYLHRLGIDVDLAPVLDTPSPSSFIRGRAYSSDAGLNGTLGSAFVRGVQAAHVAATAKHFPGLGTAALNTDQNHVYLTSPKATLDERLAPFRAAIGAGVKLVMVGNAGYRAYDPSGRPAVLSPAIVDGLLRRKLGYRGVVVSDALEAPGPSSRPHTGAQALKAGVDVLLYTSESTGADGYDRLLADARAGTVSRSVLERANARIAALKRWLGKA